MDPENTKTGKGQIITTLFFFTSRSLSHLHHAGGAAHENDAILGGLGEMGFDQRGRHVSRQAIPFALRVTIHLNSGEIY